MLSFWSIILISKIRSVTVWLKVQFLYFRINHLYSSHALKKKKNLSLILTKNKMPQQKVFQWFSSSSENCSDSLSEYLITLIRVG